VAQKSETVKRYIEETGFPLNILVDESREVLKAYGVWHRIGLDAWNVARPSLFLVEPDGRITYSFVAEKQHEFPSHDEILAALRHGQ
jgi:methyl-accepting chemotaxis protein